MADAAGEPGGESAAIWRARTAAAGAGWGGTRSFLNLFIIDHFSNQNGRRGNFVSIPLWLLWHIFITK